MPKLNVHVQRMPLFKEPTISGAYADFGSVDGSRPATFFVNLRDMKEQSKLSMRTLTYHEGIPGHLLQGSYANALTDVPTFRQLIPLRRILEIRAAAQAKLGDRFDLGEFHRTVLANGALPLDLLAAQVDAWVGGH